MATGHSDSGVPNALHMSLRSSIRPVGSIKDAGSRMKTNDYEESTSIGRSGRDSGDLHGEL